jgi:hypothetical protein
MARGAAVLASTAAPAVARLFRSCLPKTMTQTVPTLARTFFRMNSLLVASCCTRTGARFGVYLLGVLPHCVYQARMGMAEEIESA